MKKLHFASPSKQKNFKRFIRLMERRVLSYRDTKNHTKAFPVIELHNSLCETARAWIDRGLVPYYAVLTFTNVPSSIEGFRTIQRIARKYETEVGEILVNKRYTKRGHAKQIEFMWFVEFGRGEVNPHLNCIFFVHPDTHRSILESMREPGKSLLSELQKGYLRMALPRRDVNIQIIDTFDWPYVIAYCLKNIHRLPWIFGKGEIDAWWFSEPLPKNRLVQHGYRRDRSPLPSSPQA